MGIRILPNSLRMSVVVGHEVIFMSSIDVTISMEFFDSLLRPVNTVMSREFAVTFKSCE